MRLQDFLQRVLTSGLLVPQLVFVPLQGARADDLSEYALPEDLSELLTWRNGLDLEVIRIHGFGHVEVGILPVIIRNDDTIEFASDPAGFCYILNHDGSVSCVDHDGGTIQAVASSVGSFVRDYVFGANAAVFGGDDWAIAVATKLGAA